MNEFRSTLSTLAVAALLLTLGACGGDDKQAAASSEEDSPSEAASASDSPSPSASAAGGEASPVTFKIKKMCKEIDRTLVTKIAGPTLGRDVALKPGEMAPTGAQVQGFTCSIEGGQGRVEASVITVPELAERRRNMPMPSGNGITCVEVPSQAWDKSWDCKDDVGNGPILIRDGEAGVFTCYTTAKGPAKAATSNGRALCDDLLEKISG
jgi:hypothetical protein